MLELFVQWYDTVFYGKTYWQTVGIWLFDFYLWIPLFYMFLKYMVLPSYLMSRRIKYARKQKFILLAIDAPKKNEQSIIGIELALAHILGAESGPNWKEKWIDGMFQLSMSLEIVSIEGFIQLVVRCPQGWRDLVESAFYAQYPDAEITQIEDYTTTVPTEYPNPTHNMFGVEWSLNDSCFPIRTHLEFEDRLLGATIDPLAGLLEAMSKIGKGEQIWFQLLCTPLPLDWMKDCQKTVDKMTGKEAKKKESGMAKVFGLVDTVINDLLGNLFGISISAKADSKKSEDAFGAIWKMSPGDRENLEALQKKMRKPAYNIKMRYGYFAEHKSFSKPRGIQGITGAVKQFNSLGRNGFKPAMKQTGTKANYFFIKPRVAYRQKKMVRALKGRDGSVGMPPFKLNVEELATLFHFPGMLVKAPMLKRTTSVKSEAPTNLPFGEMPAFEDTSPEAQQVPMLPAEGHILPDDQRLVVESPSYTFDYDNDEFERRFAINKQSPAAQEIKTLHAEQHQVSEIDSKILAKTAPLVIESSLAALEGKPENRAVPEEPVAQVLDVFAGSKLKKNPDAAFPAQEVPALDASDMSASLPKRPKRFDPEKDTPANLPFVD